MCPAATMSGGPVIDDTGVTFRLPDPHGRLQSVRLAQQIRVPGEELGFSHDGTAWALRLVRPAVDRMEYLFEVEDHNGHRSTITDPNNPLRVAGAFGDKSVVEFPGYDRPGWLDAPRAPGDSRPMKIPSAALGITITGALWAPAALSADEPAPLVIVHDGPEYASLAALTDWAAARLRAGALPPLRVALLEPGDRNQWYAANDVYARALCDEVVPALRELAPATVRVGVGASLGALAMLHAHRYCPGTFDGLFLQSGSYFTAELDPQERTFSGFAAVTAFVDSVEAASGDAGAVPVVLTCGSIEENLANNRHMGATLARLGYPTQLHEVRDVHNYTAWRDAVEPHLTRLIGSVTHAA